MKIEMELELKLNYHACIDHRCLHGINRAHDETLTRKTETQKLNKFGPNEKVRLIHNLIG